MSFLKKLWPFGKASLEPVETNETISAGRVTAISGSLPQSNKADWQVKRFSSALETCTNPARRIELEAHLAYWKALGGTPLPPPPSASPPPPAPQD